MIVDPTIYKNVVHRDDKLFCISLSCGCSNDAVGDNASTHQWQENKDSTNTHAQGNDNVTQLKHIPVKNVERLYLVDVQVSIVQESNDTVVVADNCTFMVIPQEASGAAHDAAGNVFVSLPPTQALRHIGNLLQLTLRLVSLSATSSGVHNREAQGQFVLAPFAEWTDEGKLWLSAVKKKKRASALRLQVILNVVLM